MRNKWFLPLIFVALTFCGADWVEGKVCDITVSQQVNFGSYDPLGSGFLYTSGRFTVSCIKDENVVISISQGSSGSYLPRRMSDGTDPLDYNLYISPGYFDVWGDGTGGTGVVSESLPRKEVRTFVVYGRSPLGQSVPGSIYSDTVTILVSTGRQTDSASLGVNASAISKAVITDISDISFGAYDPTSAQPLLANGAVAVTATTGLSYSVYIGIDRVMHNGSNPLNYQLYQDLNRTVVWGSTFQDGLIRTSNSSLPQQYTIYGEIPALQDVPAGPYSDTVTVTVEW